MAASYLHKSFRDSVFLVLHSQQPEVGTDRPTAASPELRGALTNQRPPDGDGAPNTITA